MSKFQTIIALALVLTACGSNADVTADSMTTVESTGGSATETTTTGGSSSKSSANVAGTSVIVSSTGGNQGQATGGSAPMVTTTTGGSSTISSATGGNTPQSTGGSAPQATGGNAPQNTGGSNPSTGGSKATGGSTPQATGGSAPKATGGSSSTGGSSTVTTTGGSAPQATGGSSSTGGSAPQATGGATNNKLTAVQVSVGSTQTCIVVTDGRVQCWGSNNMGQLGDGTTTSHTSPVFVNGISTAVSVSTYMEHTCALLVNGTVQCWGLNMYGELGNGVATANNTNPTTPNPNPVQFNGVTNAIGVTVGANHTCIILGDHTVECVGYRRWGLLGDGTPDSSTNYYSSTPVKVTGITNAISIAANNNYTCSLLSDETIQCWGRSTNGEFVDSTGSTTALAPVSIPGVTNATQLSVGTTNICYQSDTNGSFCWGSNNYGQLEGSPSATLYYTPMSIEDVSLQINGTYVVGTTKVVIGTSHGCVLRRPPPSTSTTVIRCFGSNSMGQLGDGTTTDNYHGVLVSGITNAQDVAAGGGSTCAILSTGSLQCWGNNPGNSTNNSTTPVTVTGF